MPIFDIELLEDVERRSRLDRQQVQALADALGAVFGSDPAGTWVRMRYLERENYAENGVTVGAEVRPTFVHVLLASRPGGDALAGLAERTATVVAASLARPRANVHVLFAPPAAGRIAFGGVLVESSSGDALD